MHDKNLSQAPNLVLQAEEFVKGAGKRAHFDGSKVKAVEYTFDNFDTNADGVLDKVESIEVVRARIAKARSNGRVRWGRSYLPRDEL